MLRHHSLNRGGMPDGTCGKSLFEGLFDYPLRKAASARDYVFYFVPDSGYGKCTHRFFQKFHPITSLMRLPACRK